MPAVNPRETEEDFIKRCIPIVLDDGTAEDGSQASAICHSIFREAKKSMSTPNDLLLAEIKTRQEKKTSFNYGILTADRYVKAVQECAGSDLCYRYASTNSTSFNDVLEKASNTLTYSNTEMECEDIYSLNKFHRLDINDDQVELPKNTLLAFRHILTTPKKDRDGDIMRTQGAVVDPKMLMLWNHVHTLPIGKMIGVAEHTSKVLSLFSVIIDMNELSHDSAVMIESGMGRFSHGFRALDFEKFKEEQGRLTSPGGFDVKSFEIMEETLASVPSNTDAETQEIFLSLVEGGKLTSPIMKSFGKTIRRKRPVVIQNTIWIDDQGNISQENDDDKSGTGIDETKREGCECGKTPCSCSPKETNDDNTNNKEQETKNSEVKTDETKAGRAISKANFKKLDDVREDLKTIHKQHISTKTGRVVCEICIKKLDEVMKSVHKDEDSVHEDEERSAEVTVTEAMGLFLAEANHNQRTKMIEAIDAFDLADKRASITEKFRSLVGS